MTGEARLEVIDTLGRRLVALDKPTFTIGRRSANDLQLSCTDVSRDHAEIVWADGHFIVRDRASRCGTYVNGAAITERRRANRDTIQLGRTADAQVVFLTRDVSADTLSRSVGGGTG